MCLVSIHPMLLFIEITGYAKKLPKRCQYIPCYCSPLQFVLGLHGRWRVSIHPMLLFTDIIFNSCHKFYNVSIHPMLLFTYEERREYDKNNVSIHPMLLFTRYFSDLRNDSINVSIHPMLLFT